MSQRTKRPYRDEGDEQAMPKPEEGPTQRNNVPTPLCTAPSSGGRNINSSQVFHVCQHGINSDKSKNTKRMHKMASDDVNYSCSRVMVVRILNNIGFCVNQYGL